MTPDMARMGRKYSDYRPVVRAALARLKTLQCGDALMIVIPADQPARRDAYRSIGGAAHRLFGAGRYGLNITNSTMLVHRLPEEPK